MAGRTDSLLQSIDVRSSKGLELGPLINPVVRRDMGEIRYIDHVDTDTLRARYATHDGFDIDAIVPIDYVSTTGSIHDTVGPDIPFDYVIASHVIEHVPDIVGWLADIRSVLKDDGVLSLAIPDHRRCFDALRSPTVTADLIHAYLTKPTTPSPRQVFDHYSSAVGWRERSLGGGATVRRTDSRAYRRRGPGEGDGSEDHRRPRRCALLDVHTVVVHPAVRCSDATAPCAVLARVVFRHDRNRVLRNAAGRRSSRVATAPKPLRQPSPVGVGARRCAGGPAASDGESLTEVRPTRASLRSTTPSSQRPAPLAHRNAAHTAMMSTPSRRADRSDSRGLRRSARSTPTTAGRPGRRACGTRRTTAVVGRASALLTTAGSALSFSNSCSR